MTFEELKLIEPILKAVKAVGYKSPTPIQAKSIPLVLKGRDLLGSAQTGTGKTASFAIPILQKLAKHPRTDGRRLIRSLILAPTRELAIQIGESFDDYGKFLKLRHSVIFGGVKQKRQTDALRNGVDILIATPGRLIDLIQQGFVNLKHVEIFVLDEADRMLDMGFIHDIRKIIPRLPQRKQTLFLSATLPPEAQKLIQTLLHNPAKVEVAPTSSTAETVNQSVYFVEKSNKRKLLLHLIENEAMDSVLMFTRTKHGANRVTKQLNQAGIKALAIHGNKSQNARQKALASFKANETQVLVATDIAARGIDIDELGHVINFDLPNVPETYVHRIGRTGRAGANGKAISFCDREEVAYLRDIQRVIGKTIDPVHDHPHAIEPDMNAPAPKRGGGNRGGGRNFRPRRPGRRGRSQGQQRR